MRTCEPCRYSHLSQRSSHSTDKVLKQGFEPCSFSQQWQQSGHRCTRCRASSVAHTQLTPRGLGDHHGELCTVSGENVFFFFCIACLPGCGRLLCMIRLFANRVATRRESTYTVHLPYKQQEQKVDAAVIRHARPPNLLLYTLVHLVVCLVSCRWIVVVEREEKEDGCYSNGRSTDWSYQVHDMHVD